MLSAARGSELGAAVHRSRTRSRARPLVLAVLFGLALGAAFATVWLGLERAWTDKATTAFTIVASSGALAGLAAAAAGWLLAPYSFAIRFTAAFACLVLGTAAFASFALFLRALWTTAMPGDSLAHMIFFAITLAAGSAFSFLTLAAPLVLLPGLPLILLFAALLARRPR